VYESSNTDRLYLSEANVIVDGKGSKAMADQLTTISKERLVNKLGTISADDLRIVKIQLGMQL
jgi:mRNA interferase MazF